MFEDDNTLGPSGNYWLLARVYDVDGLATGVPYVISAIYRLHPFGTLSTLISMLVDDLASLFPRP